MFTKLFDIQNGKVTPTEHCYTIKWLKSIMDEYQEHDEYLKVYAYLQYMTCPDPEANPYFNFPESDKEDIILNAVGAEFSTEDDLIITALKNCEEVFSTPTFRAYKGIKVMLDKIARYMETEEITTGRDGNMNSIIAAVKNFDQMRASFKGAYKDLSEEQSRIRGGKNIAYDQV